MSNTDKLLKLIEPIAVIAECDYDGRTDRKTVKSKPIQDRCIQYGIIPDTDYFFFTNAHFAIKIHKSILDLSKLIEIEQNQLTHRRYNILAESEFIPEKCDFYVHDFIGFFEDKVSSKEFVKFRIGVQVFNYHYIHFLHKVCKIFGFTKLTYEIGDCKAKFSVIENGVEIMSFVVMCIIYDVAKFDESYESHHYQLQIVKLKEITKNDRIIGAYREEYL